MWRTFVYILDTDTDETNTRNHFADDEGLTPIALIDVWTCMRALVDHAMRGLVDETDGTHWNNVFNGDTGTFLTSVIQYLHLITPKCIIIEYDL